MSIHQGDHRKFRPTQRLTLNSEPRNQLNSKSDHMNSEWQVEQLAARLTPGGGAQRRHDLPSRATTPTRMAAKAMMTVLMMGL